jgi:opacity protein-like surface antigen
MKRLVIVTVFAVLVGLGGPGAGVALAQTPPKKPPATKPMPMAAAPERAYGEFTFGPTVGHKSSASFGGEGGYWFGDFVGVFAEGGRMRDVATKQIEDKAQAIAASFGATTTSKQPANYFSAGVAVRMLTSGRFTPYALVGFGVANVKNDVKFAINGADVTSSLGQFGVSLGGDLSGSYTKSFITFGVGTHVGFGGRWIADVAYRYGRIGQNSDAELDAISTNRIQFGVGAKF